jgi:hypothetical protein
VNANNDRDEQIRVARGNVRDLEISYNAALTAFDDAPDFGLRADASGIARRAARKDAERLEANRAVQAAQQPGYVSPKPGKSKAAIAAAERKGALILAEKALSDARAELNRLTASQKPIQLAAGRAINRWRDCLTMPTADAATRAYIERGNADRKERIAKGQPADGKKPINARQSELDKVLSARGKTTARKMPAYLGPR